MKPNPPLTFFLAALQARVLVCIMPSGKQASSKGSGAPAVFVDGGDEELVEGVFAQLAESLDLQHISEREGELSA